MTASSHRRVLACLDDSPAAELVLTTAANVARALDAELDVVSVVAPDEPAAHDQHDQQAPRPRPARTWGLPDGAVRRIVGPVEDTLVAELAHADVLVGVLGSRALTATPHVLGHVARAVVTTSRRPLIVVPPNSAPLTGSDQRFLVPLDGRSRTSRAVSPLLAELIEPMGTIVPLHVFDTENVPMLISSSQDQAVVADEFAALHLGSVVPMTTRPRLRLGEPVHEILEAIRRDEVDAVVVGWSQHLDAGRATVIRALLADGGVPVVFQPVDVAPADDAASP